MSSAPKFDQEAIARYADLWQRMTILESRQAAVQLVAHRIIGYKDRYLKLEKLTGIPWFFIGVLHYREADCNFHCHLHNGDPLNKRTVQVPAGRPHGEPPFTWDESALDALVYEGLDKVRVWSLERFAFQGEGYNGWGYFRMHVTSAYLWAGTSDHEYGKYTGDHHYDPNAVDKELGIMPILKVLMQLDPSVSFKSSPQSVPQERRSDSVVRPLAPPATQVAPPVPTPRPSQDPASAPATAPGTPVQRPPVTRPMTPWAAALGILTSLASSLGSAIDSLKPILHDPKVAAVVVAVAVVAGGAILWEHWKRRHKAV